VHQNAWVSGPTKKGSTNLQPMAARADPMSSMDAMEPSSAIMVAGLGWYQTSPATCAPP